jgi:AcrR family transcriptional regulator
MTRQADALKKPALLDQILDFLLDKPLSALTFRSVATALNVSTFTLVYHFGTRADLVRDIIEAIAYRQRGFEAAAVPGEITLETYLDSLQATFELTLMPRNRALQRLEIEAQMLEALEVDHPPVTRTAHQELQALQENTLVSLGLSQDEAALEGRLIIDTFYGIQVGLVVNGDDDRARAAFALALQQHRDRILALSAEAQSAA